MTFRSESMQFAVQLPPARTTRSAVIADRTLVLAAEGATSARTIFLDDVQDVSRDDNRVTITTGSGATLELNSPKAAEFAAALTDACCTLPELTGAFRFLGAMRGSRAPSDPSEFVAPFLEARRRAEVAETRAEVVAAFDVGGLEQAVRQYVRELASRIDDERPAARRAALAQATDAVQPILSALKAVRLAAPEASHPAEGHAVPSWVRWRLALQRLFAAVNTSWDQIGQSR